MCFTSSTQAAQNCFPKGSIRRILVAEVSNIQPQTAVTPSFVITNTGATRHQITSIDATLDFYEIEFDRTNKKDASASATNNRAGAPDFTHTVLVNISSDEFDITRQLIEGQSCCGYIVLVQNNSGKWYMLGLDYDIVTAEYNPAYMLMQHDATTGTRKNAEDAGSTLTFIAESVSNTWIPVSTAAAEGVTIVAHTP